MQRVCVFCGSSRGARPIYVEAARQLARELSQRKLGLVYGGGNVGLMGVLADEMLALGAEVIGVIPETLVSLEVAHTGLRDLRVVDSMHARKAMMADTADGFVALPGGLGTLEEFLEVLTWAQLGMHDKPMGLLDVHGYFEPLLQLLDHAVDERFLRAEHRALISVAMEPGNLLEAMAAAPRMEQPEKWIDRDQR